MEEWRDIPGFEGYYEANRHGEIRNKRTGRILSQGDYKGYRRVSLCKDGVRSTQKVHRIIATTFIPNEENLPYVNHKDCNPANNEVFINPDGSVNPEKSNLEWCTPSYNTNYADANKKRGNNWKDNTPKQVYQYTVSGDLLRVWRSTRSVEDETGFCHSSIGRCCNGITKEAYGYVWSYNEL